MKLNFFLRLFGALQEYATEEEQMEMWHEIKKKYW